MLQGLRLVSGSPAQLAETEVAMGNEGAHAARLGQRKCPPVVALAQYGVEPQHLPDLPSWLSTPQSSTRISNPCSSVNGSPAARPGRPALARTTLGHLRAPTAPPPDRPPA